MCKYSRLSVLEHSRLSGEVWIILVGLGFPRARVSKTVTMSSALVLKRSNMLSHILVLWVNFGEEIMSLDTKTLFLTLFRKIENT
jgi:hypothetical protein